MDKTDEKDEVNFEKSPEPEPERISKHFPYRDPWDDATELDRAIHCHQMNIKWDGDPNGPSVLDPINWLTPKERATVEHFEAERNTPTIEFRKEGKKWRIGRKGESVEFENSVGLMRLHYLLNNPGKEFAPHEFHRKGEGKDKVEGADRASIIKTIRRALKEIHEKAGTQILREYLVEPGTLKIGSLSSYTPDSAKPVHWLL